MKSLKKIYVSATLLSASMIGVGCGTAQTQPEVDNPVSSNYSGPIQVEQGSIRYDTDDARVASLWADAELARSQNNNELALRRIFEALEITPQNGLFWSRAAEIQLDNQEGAVAENFAMKSNDFAGTNVSLLHRNWLIIEHARSLRGDLLGVRSAHKKVQEYQYQ